MYIWLNSTKSIVRGLGACPQKNLKIKPSEIESEGILMVYCLDYSKAAHCRIIIVQLFGYVVDYIISLRNCITSLRDYIRVNLKGTLLDMNHITTLRIQSINIIIW